MHRSKGSSTIGVAMAGALLLAATGTANAVPLTGTINTGGNFSVVHTGANPGGTQPSTDWYWFDAGQQIALDLTDGILSAAGPQTFTLETPAGVSGTLLLTSLLLDLDAGDGFAGGSLSYVLNGTTAGSFSFADLNYGNSVFNSSSIEDGVLTAYVWGGDAGNDLGIDLSISATVPEPGTLLLILPGMAAAWMARRRESAATG